MKLIFLGPPGAGKGTLAALLSKEKGIPHISTGDIIRAAIRNESPLGKQVKEIVEGGKLVPDDLTIALVEERLKEADTKAGFILDGFPRTIPQADALKNMADAKLDKVVNFVLAEDEIVKRLSGRRVHKASGRTYHVLFNPPKVPNKDDVSGEELWQRPDDTEESIKTRLEVYAKQTAPLIDYYKNEGLLIDIDASPKPELVFEALLQNL